VTRATVDRGIRRSAVGGHDAVEACAPQPSRVLHAGHQPKLAPRLQTGLSPLSRVPNRGPVRVTKRSHAVHWEIGSSSGPFSPREFVAPTRGFKPSGARCSPGFSISSGSSPSSPWSGATTGPPLTGLTRGPAPLRERFPSTDTTGASVGCLSECQRTMKLAGLSRDRRTLMRFRTSSSYRAVQRPGAPGS
jgi:hypothetical protein